MGVFTMRCFSLLVSMMILVTPSVGLAQSPAFNLGRTPTESEIQAWDISIGPEGKELPPGSGTAVEGVKIYEQKCLQCHGPKGEQSPTSADVMPGLFRLVGGRGTLNTPTPVRTVGSFWPFATTVWDYINRAMPRFEEGSLSADEVYALTAALLYWNGIIQETDTMDAKTLPKVQMPNRNGFVPAQPDYEQFRECNPNHPRCAGSLLAK